MNIRPSMMAWNFLFLDTKAFVPDPQQSAEWNRGAYLVQGAAHCGTCHTPRGFLMQEEASRRFLGRAQVGPWYAPNITSDPVSGIGSWTKEELAAYLRTGHLPGKAQAAGSMGEAVEHSFQYLVGCGSRRHRDLCEERAADPRPGRRRFALHGGKEVLRAWRRCADATASVSRRRQSHRRRAVSRQLRLLPLGRGARQQGRLLSEPVPQLGDGRTEYANLIAAILYGVDRTSRGRQAFMPGFGGHPATPPSSATATSPSGKLRARPLRSR